MFQSSLTSPRFFCGLLSTALVFATGCDMPLEDPAVPSQQTLLVLDNGLQSDNPVSRISADFDVIRGEDLALTGKRDARDLLVGVRGMGVSLDGVSDDQIQTWKPLVRAALAAGIPLFIDSVDHAAQMTELIGIGIEAELLMITATGPDRHRVRSYGANELLTQAMGESGDLVALTPSFAEDVERGVSDIREQLRSFQANPTAKSATDGYEYYLLDFSHYLWNVTGSQVAILDLDFEAELVHDDSRGQKYLFIRPIGSGHYPGTLEWNKNSKRGFYQEAITVTITPSNTNVDIYDHQPESANEGTTYTSTTGWSIGLSGSSPEISFNSSEQNTTTVPDFEMINHVSGDIASWTMKMKTSWTNMFNHPFMQMCKVKSLPNLAKSNLRPDFEVIYRADDSYNGTVTFDFDIVAEMRKIWRGGTIFNCEKNSTWTVKNRSSSLSIDFGDV